MLIRPAESRDARAMAEVHVASWRSAYRGVLPDKLLEELSVDERTKWWEMVLAGRDRTRGKLVCEQEGRVVGFSSFGPSRDPDHDSAQVAELYALYALQEVWGVGCGRALWLETQRRVRDDPHVEAVAVWVLTANIRGRHFYEKTGFLVDGASKDITLYGVTVTETRYRRPIHD
jgi:GNAT superfamily N-acetyltransferase